MDYFIVPDLQVNYMDYFIVPDLQVNYMDYFIVPDLQVIIWTTLLYLTCR